MSARKKSAILYLRGSHQRQLPFGYEPDGRPKHEMSIRANPGQAKRLVQIYHWLADGMSIEQIVKKLNRPKARKRVKK